MQEKKLEMYGGLFGGLIPLIVLVGGLVWLSVAERGGTKPFWACAWIALCVGIFFAKNKEEYCKAAMRGIGDRTGIVIVTAWLLAGVFGKLMAAGGLVQGLLWMGMTTGAQGGVFVVLVFLAAMLFALGTGTSTGTCIALSPVLYPAGYFLGADPAMLGLAILSGAAFGDNLAPISDTTIVSAYTQGAEMRDVVRSRFPLAISAASISAVVFLVFGGGGEVRPLPEMQASLNPSGLFMLLALGIVVVSALKGRHIIESLIYGNVAAAFVGMLIGTIRPADIFSVPAAKGGSTGLIQAGIDNVVGAIIFAILILAVTQILVECGIMRRILDFAQSTLVATVPFPPMPRRNCWWVRASCGLWASVSASRRRGAPTSWTARCARSSLSCRGISRWRRGTERFTARRKPMPSPPRPSARPCTTPIHGHCSRCCCSPPSPAGTASTPRMKRPPHDFGRALPRNQAERRGATSALRKGRATLPALLAP